MGKFMGGMGGYFRECPGEVSTIALCCLQWTASATVRQGTPAIGDHHTGNVIHGRGGEGGDGADGNHHDAPGGDDHDPAVSSIPGSIFEVRLCAVM
ncbi:MAG: hypothetical protein ACLP51_03445 [Syntrophobacteraceae bacterium]